MAVKSCFVIQPFDRAEYDERFDAVLLPAIREAGLEAYRTDRDPTTDVSVADIKAGIRRAYVCVADVTTNNPNIWFEVGFALACQKRLCLGFVWQTIFAPEGRRSIARGVSPWGKGRPINGFHSPGGAAVSRTTAAPPGLKCGRRWHVSLQGFHPWLFTPAPPGRKSNGQTEPNLLVRPD